MTLTWPGRRRAAAPGETRVRGTGRGWLAAVTALWLLLGLLPLAVLTSSSITLSDDTVRTEVYGRVGTTASVSRVVVDQQMSSLKQLVSAFAQRPDVRTAVTAKGTAARSTAAGYLTALARMRSGVSGVILIGSDGEMVDAEPRSMLPQDVSGADWYITVRARNQATVSEAYTPAMMGISRAVAVAAPIPRPDGQGLTGVLAVIYSLAAIQDFASQAADAQGMRLLITDQAGVLVADPARKLYALTSLREDPRVDAALAGRTLFTRYHGFDGTVLSASEPIPGIGWTVTAEVPVTQALASVNRLRMRILSVAGVLAVLLLAGLALQIHTTRGRRRAQRALADYAEALAAARDEAVRASTAKTEFLAKVSHEIRTPVNGVLGMNALLLGTRLDDEQRHYTSTVQASAENVLHLLDDFLDLSKAETGHLEVETVPFDLPRLCDEVVAPLAPHAYQRGLWLRLHLDDDLPQQVVADPVRLHQVLSNLLGNALKFTTQGGVDLEVTLDGPGTHGADQVILRFSVTDTGVGVGADDQERVFEIFRRVDSPITRRTSGSGLGLAISRQLVELMGGRIELESVAGIGSRFHVTLPAEVLTWSAPAPDGSSATSGRRVLVADARPDDRSLAVRTLTGAGLIVAEAPDAPAALATLRAAASTGRPFDLAVVDLDMAAAGDERPAETGRGADGTESLADAILSDPLLCATDIVIVVTLGRTGSAWPDSSAADRPIQSITRPLSRRRLLAAVQNALRAAEAHGSSTSGLVTDAGAPDDGCPPVAARILVVEDDKVSGQVAETILRKAGHRVDVVGDGEQAVRAVISGDYDLVFMDCQLPVVDGLTATADIRRLQHDDDRIPIIAMTAAATPDDRIRCLDAGMDDHLAKPVDWQHVLDHIPVWTGSAATSPGPLVPPGTLLGLSSEDVAEIIQVFLATAPDTLRRLRDAVEKRDLPRVASLAHRLKGSCATIGAAGAVTLCERIEELANVNGSPATRDDALFPALMAELTDELRRTSGEVSRLTSKA